MTDYRLGLAGLADAAGISSLRTAAYSFASEFELADAKPLQWGREDDENLVFAVWDGDHDVVSTLRAELYFDARTAETHMECSLPAGVEFPAMLMGKAASAITIQKTGLHSLLRYVAVQCALSSQVRTLLGIVFEGAPRTKLMQRCGYEFCQPERVWYTDLVPRRPTLVATLERARFLHCRNVLWGSLGAPCADVSITIHRASAILAARIRVPRGQPQPMASP